MASRFSLCIKGPIGNSNLFSFEYSINMIFPNCLGFEFCVLFCSWCNFYYQLNYPPMCLLSLVTLRDPSPYCKKKIMLQDILRCTDTLLVRRWFYGGHVLGNGLSELSQTAKGYLFVVHRPTVPWPERLGD